MAKFIVLLTDDPCYWAQFSPEQMGDVMKQYAAWGMKMHASRRIKIGHKLADEGGKRMQKVRGKLKVTDGPFTESHEVIGGFYVIEADSYDHCLELFADHPHIAHGHPIDLRAIDAPSRGRAKRGRAVAKPRSKKA